MAQVILSVEPDEILRAFTTGAKNEGFRLLLQKGLNAMLDRESSEQLGAKRYERTEERTDSRNGVRTRELKTGIGRYPERYPDTGISHSGRCFLKTIRTVNSPFSRP